MSELLQQFNHFSDGGSEKQNERISLELDNSSDQPRMKIRQERYADGMGWIIQKTITLELAQAEKLLSDLQAQVTNSRMLISDTRRLSRKENGKNSGKLLELPRNRPSRAKSGESEPGEILPFKRTRK
jgi:hypothetical protein